MTVSPLRLGARTAVELLGRMAAADREVADLGERWLAVEVADERGRILGAVMVKIEPTGSDPHDAIHAIIAAGDGLASAEISLDWWPGHADGAPDPVTGPMPEPVAEGGAIRCGEPGCPGNIGRGLPPARHTCALGRDLYPNS